jgi:hypothetical protein
MNEAAEQTLQKFDGSGGYPLIVLLDIIVSIYIYIKRTVYLAPGFTIDLPLADLQQSQDYGQKSLPPHW